MHTTDCNFLVILNSVPLVSQEMPINWSGLRNIFISDALIGFANYNVRGELTAYNWNIGRKVHPYHSQHAASSSSSLSLAIINNSEKLRNPNPNPVLPTLSSSKPGNGRRRPGGSAIYYTSNLASLD
uniref:Uncharacterized protein n=1 Tax=Opuntia streptacantha TaxID=393608 RepID=A0A7C9EG13_OPUST